MELWLSGIDCGLTPCNLAIALGREAECRHLRRTRVAKEDMIFMLNSIKRYLLFSTEHQIYSITSIGVASMRRHYEQLTLLTDIRDEDGK